MKDILVNKLKVMSDDVAEALLNAELNVPEVNVVCVTRSNLP